MNNSNNSIKAIIFTITLFLFILFISLFKGIHLYNIHLKNTSIKHLFIKINHKIVLKIYNININKSSNNPKKETNLNKKLFLITKLLNFFEKIDIKYLNYDKYSINNIIFKNKVLIINSSYTKLKALINNNIIFFNYIQIPIYQINLKNILLKLEFNNKYNIKTLTNNNNINIHMNICNNKIFFILNTKSYNYKNIKIISPIIKGEIDLNNLNYHLAGKISSLEAIYDKKKINVHNINFNIQNSKIYSIIKTVQISNIPQINRINISDIKVSYYTKHKFLTLKSKNIKTKYKKYKIKLDNNFLIYRNFNNFVFKSEKANISDNNNSINFNNVLINIFYKFKLVNINATQFNNKNIHLKSSKIISDFQKIFTNIINGTIYGFQTHLNKINIDITQKSAKIDSIIINNVKANNIMYKNNIVTFHSNNLFNKNIKKILKKFININIPIRQIKGNNNIITTIKINKNFDFNTHIITKNSLLKLYDYNISTPYSEINITNNNLSFHTKNTKLTISQFLKINYTGDGLLNFNKLNLLMNGNINFRFDNIIKLNNFKDTIALDLNSNTLKTKNSNLFIDFNNNQLIINSLKNILKYTIFQPFISNGIILVTFKNNINIINYFKLKLPILYKHNNKMLSKNSKTINKVFLHIKIKKDKFISLYNKYINILLKNNYIISNINNIDINLYPLSQLLNKKTQSNKFNYSIILQTTNSNLIYKQHKILSQKATLIYKKGKLKINSKYRNSSINGYTKHGYLLLEAKNFSTEELISLLPEFNFFDKINLDFIMVQSPDDFYSGKIFINNAVVRELKTLNNIIAFINTIPSLLSFKHPGFSSKGYKIEKGFINYLLYKKILYIKQANIKGKNLDFFAKGYIDFNKNYIFVKLTVNMKINIKNIPILGKVLSYLLFGKDGSITTKIIVKGDLDNPKVYQDLGKEILQTPFDLFKRAITLPFNLF